MKIVKHAVKTHQDIPLPLALPLPPRPLPRPRGEPSPSYSNSVNAFTCSAGNGGWYPAEDVFSSFLERLIVIIETCVPFKKGKRKRKNNP